MKPLFFLTQATMAIATLWCTQTIAFEQSERIGSWDYLTIEDKMEDKLRYIAIARGTNGSIALKCDSVGHNSIYAGFYATNYLGEGRYGRRPLRYRIDKNPPVSEEWSYDKSSAHQFDHSMADKFAQMLANGNVLLINATTYELRTVEAEISVDGAARAVKKLRADCQN